MKLLQINVTANWGSTGRIAEQIGQIALSHGWESYIAYGRGLTTSQSKLLKVGNKLSICWHVLISRLFDKHGLASKRATKRLVDQISQIAPDIIHLHNIHGYYLNYEILFDFLAEYQKPIVWTLHDCWAFTGHCAYFDSINCQKWGTQCHTCALKGDYPASILLDRSAKNFALKKLLFSKVGSRLHLVPVSDWLHGLVKRSFLQSSPCKTIHNGIDVSVFSSRTLLNSLQTHHKNKFVVLGVASVWDTRKGLADLIQLRSYLPIDEYDVVVVGLSDDQCHNLPSHIHGITRTESIGELVSKYSLADVFVNPTYSDNYPTTNLEAMACGTPVITYRTGGSPEAVTKDTGFVVEQGDVRALADAIMIVKSNGKEQYSVACRQRAEQYFDKDKCYQQYIDLYNALIKENGDAAR